MLIIGVNSCLWAGIINTDGIIIQRDFNFPVFKESFQKQYYPLWNDLTSQPNFERLPRLVLFAPFIALSEAGVEIPILLKIMIISMFTFLSISMYLFLSSLLKHLHFQNSFTEPLAILGSFIFAYNPVNIQFSGGLSLALSVAALPLLLYIIIAKTRSILFPLLASGALLLSLGHPFIFVMNSITGFLFFVVFNKGTGFRIIVPKLVVTLFTFTLLFSWYIIPYYYFPVASTELGRESNIERSTFDLVSNNNYYKILLSERDRFVYINTDPANSDLSNIDIANSADSANIINTRAETIHGIIHYSSLALLVVISFSALLFFKELKDSKYKKIFFFFCGGFLIATLFSLGSSGPIGEIYWKAIESSGGWIIRSPLKFQLYQAFFISVLFILSLAAIRYKFRYNRLVPIILSIFIILGSSSYGIYDANFQSFNPISLPKEYKQISDILESAAENNNINAFGKVIYYPRYNEISTNWSAGHKIAPYDMKSSKLATYDTFTGYNNVREMLYEYPYTKSLFKTNQFFDYLLSVGIRYIVFHNDRELAIDSANLGYLKASSDRVDLIYNSDKWYLFRIKEGAESENINKSTEPVNILSNLVIVQDKANIFELSSPDVGTIYAADINDSNIESSKIVKLKLFHDTIDTSLENKLKNPDFSDWELTTSDGNNLDSAKPKDWTLLNKDFTVAKYYDKARLKDYIEITSPHTYSRSWSALISSPINVTSGESYLVTSEIKTANVFGTHVKIQGYQASEHRWKDMTYITKGMNGTMFSLMGDTGYKIYSKTITISENITMLRYIINGGGVLDTSKGNATSWISNTGIYNLEKLGNETVKNKNDTFTKISYSKISPTHWQVRVNTTSEFVLTLAESFDRGWMASAYAYGGAQKNGDLSANAEILNTNTRLQFKNIPIYGTINGFFINRTGSFTIDIEFIPQKMFESGMTISIIALSLFLSFIGITKIKIIKDHITYNNFISQMRWAMIRKVSRGGNNDK